MRAAPRIPIPPRSLRSPQERGRVVQERTYELITPLFGGGAKPREPDPVSVIRGPSIRGQLRFWWRACQGGRFTSIEELKAAEDALWGAPSGADVVSPAGPEPVKIAVTVTHGGRPEQAYEVKTKKDKSGRDKLTVDARNGIAPAYVSFPLQPAQQDLKVAGQETHTVQTGVKFILRISSPANPDEAGERRWADEMQGALWAWETFGGVGGRTRRGFGAVRLTSLLIDGRSSKPDLPGSAGAAADWLAKSAERFVKRGVGPTGVPTLQTKPRFEVRGDGASAHLAWSKLINCYRTFRQQRKDNEFGASLWPEASLIRRVHQGGWRAPESPDGAVDKLPRAQLGLPIVFHFQPIRNQPSYPDVTATTADEDRWASPLILRPLACRDGKCVSLALRLRSPRLPASGLSLKEMKPPRQSICGLESHLTPTEHKALADHGLVLPNTDVVEAFLNYLSAF